MRRSLIQQASGRHAKRLLIYLRRALLIVHPWTRESQFTANNRICWAWNPCTLTVWVLHRARAGSMVWIMTHQDYPSWRRWDGQLNSLLSRKRLCSRSIHSHETGSSYHRAQSICSIMLTALLSPKLPRIGSLVTPWFTKVKSIT